MSKKKSQEYVCKYCDFTTHKKSNYNAHISTEKHKINSSENAETEIIDIIYECSACKYQTIRKANYERHMWSVKHKQKKHNANFSSDEDEEHQEPPEEIMQNMKITPQLMLFLIQQNKQMQQMMLEQNQQNRGMVESLIELAKNMGSNNSNASYNNNGNYSNNKSFNLNFFLNETCKNAMNMSDFVKNLDVTTFDFEQTGQFGYVEGMSRILEKGLNKLEVHERPIHCTDAKRETIYIKDNDKWEKDDDKKTKLLGVVKQVGAKNINVIPQWCKENPGWCDSDSKENDRYLKYVFNSMCGGTDEEIQKNYGDIMRHMCKITVVDKKESISL
jgi:hypothetical protein